MLPSSVRALVSLPKRCRRSFIAAPTRSARVSIFGARLLRRRPARGCSPQVNRSPWVTQAQRRARAADPVQPRAPRRRQRHRLPLLPHVGRGLVVRRHPADQDLHELPLADLRQQPVPRAGARRASRPDAPIEWTRVHDLPDFVYFDHSIHVNKGVGCTTCHGQVDRMPLMWQEQSLQMEWCLDCHRNPERYVRPREAVFSRRLSSRRPISSSSASGWSPSTSIQKLDELLDVSSDEKPRAAEPCRRRQAAKASGVRSTSWRTIRRSQSACTTSSRRRSKRSPTRSQRRDVPEADGRVAGAGRRHRLHAAAAPRRSSPTSGSPRSSFPGKPLFYATAMTLGGVATGLLVESHEGRPTKIEGNPEHPGSLGATDVFAQAAILDLYDPDRSQTLTNLGEIRPWPAFLGAIRAALAGAAAAQGRRPAHPDRDGQLADARPRRFASCSRASRRRKWHQWDPAEPRQRARRRAARVRRDVDAQYRFDAGRRHPRRSTPTSSACGPGSLRYAREFAGAAAARAGRSHEPALRRRDDADVDRRARRPSAAAASPSEIETIARAARGGARRRARPAGVVRRASPSARRAGSPPSPRICRRTAARASSIAGDDAAAGRPRARARDEPGARQRRPDGRLHRAGRGRAGRSGRSRCASSSPT